MCPRRSHTLATLNIMMSNKSKFEWTKVEHDDLNKIKRTMARDNLSTYPDFNGTLNIHTYASAFQLGAVISQKFKPITFYGRKITDTQQRYKLTEKELLRNVGTLKKFRNILLGEKIIIYTDN